MKEIKTCATCQAEYTLDPEVPHLPNTGTGNKNCDWADDVWHSTDVYLSRSFLRCERCSYLYRMVDTKDTIDSTYSFNLEQSYDCLYCFRGYKLFHSFNSRDCVDSSFLYDCRNCSSCFMCWNLRNKEDCILNKQYSKEEYAKKLQEFDVESYAGVEKLKQEFTRILQEEAVHRANFNTKVENSTGNFLTECKNCHNCYFMEKTEDVRHGFRGASGVKDGIDAVSPLATERSAVSSLDQEGYGNMGMLYGTRCKFSYYLDNCEACENCFGCVGMRKAEYCVLNQQYSKEEYEKLTEQIKADMKKRGEWGKFFPLEAAYSGYNLSLGQIMFPDTKEAVLKRGGKWDEEEVASFEDALKGEDLPDRIDEVDDSIVGKRIICPETGLSYSIARHELAFYRKHKIPLPQKHFDQRTLERFRPMTFMTAPQTGTCIFCQKEHTHYYAPELGYQKIACVECYREQVG